MRPSMGVDQSAGRIVRMLCERPSSAIFGHGDGQFRTQRVRVIQHGPEIAGYSDVPAEIPVVTDRVSRPDDDVTRLDIGDCAAHMRR